MSVLGSLCLLLGIYKGTAQGRQGSTSPNMKTFIKIL
jgi:hypothetical protein